VAADHRLIATIVSVAVMFQGMGVEANEIDPLAADASSAWLRVVLALKFAVWAAPGSPIWSWTYSAGAMKLDPFRVLSQGLTRFAVLSP
jgi:hypothetical protein